MTHVAESLHWYGRDGSPQYTVKARDGSDRPATLRDARKLNLVPSVTAIIKCAAAPGLEIWKQNQVLLAALTLGRGPREAEKDYLARIMSDSKEHARKAAERGAAIHAAIQGAYEDETPASGYEPYIQGACKVISDWGGGTWIAEKSFSHPLGFGGKVDLHGTVGGVIDFKTKEFSEGDDLKTWDEHAMQLAAYRHGLRLGNTPAAIVYVSTTNPGLCKLIEISQAELDKGWTMFYSLLHYWQAKNAYKSSFNLEAVAA